MTWIVFKNDLEKSNLIAADYLEAEKHEYVSTINRE